MADEDAIRGPIREKLVSAKERRAREGRRAAPRPGTEREPASERPRLPPGQREVENWPVLDLGVQPLIAREEWELTVDGLVEVPVRWRWDDFAGQPVFRDTSDIHCVTAWSRFDNDWEGVSAAHLLSVVRPSPGARHVILHSHDGYTTNLALDAFAAPDVLLACRWQGEPLSREHGGPVRAIVPRYYFWKSAKWLRRIEFSADDKPGFWEVRGYHNRADPWLEERFG